MSEFAARLRRRYRALFADPVQQAFFAGSGYANYGYWTAATTDGAAACDALVDRLLQHVPATATAVLDVACGHGGTTRRLAQRFAPHAVTAVDLLPEHVRAMRGRNPTARPAVMDAVQLGFRDGSFDALLCVEAAFHFETRERFFAEAARVLRPGGRLLLADVLLRCRAGRVPRQNVVRRFDDYRAQLRRQGFSSVEFDDISAQSWRAFRRRYAAFALRQRGVIGSLRRGIPWALFHGWRALLTDFAIARYFLAVASKP